MNGGYTIIKFNDVLTEDHVLEEGILLYYWGNKCRLSAIVSTIGKHISTDKVTRERSMVKFARVLVEMEITDKPLRVIHFLNEHGQLIEQVVEYEWLSVRCKACQGYGIEKVDVMESRSECVKEVTDTMEQNGNNEEVEEVLEHSNEAAGIAVVRGSKDLKKLESRSWKTPKKSLHSKKWETSRI
uniref:DUF4283 domain-containing protein n=1 Tax=Cannabis sativa TaxID=3483 RepID=A0A803QP39_CANSA